jgi:hypothetical protein
VTRHSSRGTSNFNNLKQIVRELAEAQSPKRKEPHPFYMPVIINPMKLPNIERAFIRPEKITQYLLSENHSVGQYKARFFLGFGFSLPSWQQLETALLQQASQYEVAQMEATPFGVSYAIDGSLPTPDGRNPQVRTVWFIETGQTAPYFITAHPLKRVR